MDQSRPTEKPCTRCGVIKPLDDFHRSQSAHDGRTTRCRPCARAIKQERRAALSDDERAAQRARHTANERDRRNRTAESFKVMRERVSASLAAKECSKCRRALPLDAFSPDPTKLTGHHSRCRECARETARLLWAQKKEEVRAKNREWYAANREKMQAKRQRPDIQERTREQNRRFREANPSYSSEWYQANRERTLERTQRRRALRMNATVGRIDRAALWEACDGKCGICDEVIDRELRHPHPKSPSLDHIVPLSKGGAHSQENLRWVCLVCNLIKGARLPD